jgi:trimeric autotransporter adhesin
MGTSLINTKPKDTYSGLLKTTDSLPLNAVLRRISDGNGNDSPLLISTLDITNRGGGGIASNTAFGEGSLDMNTTGFDNASFGQSALGSNLTGNSNSAFGHEALLSSTGSFNTAFGKHALRLNTASNNTAFGSQTLAQNISGVGLTAVGYQALRVSTGGNNTALGSVALTANTTGTNNTAIGVQSLTAVTTGVSNTGVGSFSLLSNVTGSNNTAIGQNALLLYTGSDNTAIGQAAAQNNVSGIGITAVGFEALKGTTGSNNTAVGHQSLLNNTTGINNTAIGAGTISGNFSNSVILGKDATATANNQFVVGSSGTNAGVVNSNGFLIGANSAWNVKVNGTDYNIPVAGTSSLARLQIQGSGTTSATTSLLVQNSAGTQYLKVADDGIVSIGSSITVSSGAISNASVLSSTTSIRQDSGGVTGVIRHQGNQIGMGDNSTGNTSALLTLTSTTKGFLPPRMTTAEKNAIATPAAGLVIYDTTLNKLCVRTAAAWETITSL